jgi:hypothetical protein
LSREGLPPARHLLIMEPRSAPTGTGLVRCLDCGTVYEQPAHRDESAPCPTCGYVGWIVLAAEDDPDTSEG